MTERNYSIDILKFICAVLVITIHTEWNYQQAILPFAKCAVPCFFIISGYLLFDKTSIKPERLNRTLIHIGGITLWATSMFIFLKETLSVIRHGSLWLPSFNDFVAWLFFNHVPFAYHLWYLYAYIYVLMIVLVINKYNKWRVLYWITPILLLIDLTFGKYSLLIWEWEPPYICLRNFLFFGLPYFAIGTMIKRDANHCLKVFNKKLLYSGVLFFTLTLYIEKHFLLYLDRNASREHYISHVFLSCFLVMIALSINSKTRSIFSKLGEKDSLYIYIFHPVFIICCTSLFEKMQLSIFYMYFSPIIVLSSTILFINCIRRMNIIE